MTPVPFVGLGDRLPVDSMTRYTYEAWDKMMCYGEFDLEATKQLLSTLKLKRMKPQK